MKLSTVKRKRKILHLHLYSRIINTDICTKEILFSGPVPTFFSDKPEDTLEDLKKSPEWAFQCLQALVSRLLVRGQLTV